MSITAPPPSEKALFRVTNSVYRSLISRSISLIKIELQRHVSLKRDKHQIDLTQDIKLVVFVHQLNG